MQKKERMSYWEWKKERFERERGKWRVPKKERLQRKRERNAQRKGERRREKEREK